MAPSSSGLGRQVFILKITGSNPVGVTNPIMSTFWKKIPTPFLVLAPMDDVTDVVFREIIHRVAAPDVYFTEFTSADGLVSRGRDKVIEKLRFTENQHPIIAQIWGRHPETLGEATTIVKELGFDGVDINMGCPVEAVVRKGAGAGCIGNYKLVRELISSVRKHAGSMSVSVKTRLGIKDDTSQTWIPFLLEQNLDALTIHGRTAHQLSHDRANWDAIKQAVEFKNKIAPSTIIIGNGDVLSYDEALERHKATGVDGVMIGRGVFKNVRVFEKKLRKNLGTKSECLALFTSHMKLFEETWGDQKPFFVLKKFAKMYIKGFSGSSVLRQQILECQTRDDMIGILNRG